MKVIKCEMCGSNDVLKQNGYYICQSCGTKYAPEDAKKLLVEGVVQIDNTEKISNLYTLARRARNNNNAEDAEKYYDEIRKEKPNDWESNYYAIYYKAYNCKLGEIYSAANSVSGSIHSTFHLIDASELDSSARVQAFEDVSFSCIKLAELLSTAEFNRYDDIDLSIRSNYSAEHDSIISAIASIRFNLWDEFCYNYADDELLMRGVGIRVLKYRIEHFYIDDDAKQVISVIQKYEPDYTVDTSEQDAIMAEADKLLKEMENTLEKNNPDNQKNGCYIATAVYGSYDCPQVWTLRRYRDYRLAETLFGRAFIKMYYLISPSFVSIFGQNTLFKRFWKKRLDMMVLKLNNLGFDNTPYEDKSK